MYLGEISVPSASLPPRMYVVTAHGDSCQLGGRWRSSTRASGGQLGGELLLGVLPEVRRFRPSRYSYRFAGVVSRVAWIWLRRRSRVTDSVDGAGPTERRRTAQGSLQLIGHLRGQTRGTEPNETMGGRIGILSLSGFGERGEHRSGKRGSPGPGARLGEQGRLADADRPDAPGDHQLAVRFRHHRRQAPDLRLGHPGGHFIAGLEESSRPTAILEGEGGVHPASKHVAGFGPGRPLGESGRIGTEPLLPSARLDAANDLAHQPGLLADALWRLANEAVALHRRVELPELSDFQRGFEASREGEQRADSSLHSRR